MFYQLDEISKEILRKYKTALKYIGVDFSREDVQEAIVHCYSGMEGAFQSVIDYWFWLKQQDKKIDYPSALLIEAVNEKWKPRNWQDEYLEDSRFKSPCQLWWEKAAEIWGEKVRNQLIADVTESDSGHEYILLMSGEKIALRVANMKGWDWVLEYAQTVNS